MDPEQNFGEMIAHEEEIFDEGQIEGEYYEEYINVDETEIPFDIYYDTKMNRSPPQLQKPYYNEHKRPHHVPQSGHSGWVRNPPSSQEFIPYNNKVALVGNYESKQRPYYGGQNRPYHVPQSGHSGWVRNPPSSQEFLPYNNKVAIKPCNCTKSTCLKLYCDCFANGEFCLDCNCKDCHNNLEHEQERSRAIKSSLDRNPGAFKPKIGVSAKVGRNIDMERLHQKGCHCKKSNCLKNYFPCTDRCKCCSCRNTEADRHKYKDKLGSGIGGLAQLAAVAAADARSSSPFSDDESDSGAVNNETPNFKTQPWFYMQEDVIEATTNCLVAQAKESEDQEGMTEEMEERDVLIEFGRCLKQIIDNAKACLVSQR